MASNHHNDEVFRNKRRPKGPSKYNIGLSDEQKSAKQTIINSDVVAIKGQAGSGKTLVAVQTALDLYYKGEVDKIQIARPYVPAGEDIGFLPGGIDAKLSGFTAPIYNIIEELIGKKRKDSLIESEAVTVLPFGFLRGNTFTRQIVIIDEAQNATMKQVELMLGRLGKNSKMVFCGDMSQCDLVNKKQSGFDFFRNLDRVDGVEVLTLLSNHRNPIVAPILNVFKEYNS